MRKSVVSILGVLCVFFCAVPIMGCVHRYADYQLGTTVRGHVVDAQTGTPVEQAELILHDRDAGFKQVVGTSDSTGGIEAQINYRWGQHENVTIQAIRDKRKRRFVLVVAKEGYRSLQFRLDPFADTVDLGEVLLRELTEESVE